MTRRAGFSLIEVLLAIALIVMMVGALFDGVGVAFVGVSDPPLLQPAAVRIINVHSEIRISVPKPNA